MVLASEVGEAISSLGEDGELEEDEDSVIVSTVWMEDAVGVVDGASAEGDLEAEVVTVVEVEAAAPIWSEHGAAGAGAAAAAEVVAGAGAGAGAGAAAEAAVGQEGVGHVATAGAPAGTAAVVGATRGLLV